MKITPAHDQLDYEIGRRHNLPVESCIDQAGRLDLSQYIAECNDGKVTRRLQHFHGTNQYKAKEMIVRSLIPKDLYR